MPKASSASRTIRVRSSAPAGKRAVERLANDNPAVRVIENFMTRSPHSIGKDQTLAVAHGLMRTYRIRHLPVLQAGKLIGIVSQRDLYFLESIAGVNPETDIVEDAMSSDTYRVKPTEPLARVVRKMAEKKMGSAVVVEDDEVVGVFTTTDALGALSRLLDGKGGL
jgi:acetoin utilization protein AcuB